MKMTRGVLSLGGYSPASNTRIDGAIHRFVQIIDNYLKFYKILKQFFFSKMIFVEQITIVSKKIFFENFYKILDNYL